MRPSEKNTGKPIYECLGCGTREREPESAICPDCGFEMRNLGQPRDR
jgi:rRNA maturation endonuclease Nob1